MKDIISDLLEIKFNKKLNTKEYVVFYLDRISNKLAKISADNLILKKRNHFLVYVKEKNEYIPFNAIQKITLKGKVAWSKGAFEKENCAAAREKVVKMIKSDGCHAVYDFFKEKKRFIGMVEVYEHKSRFLVTIDECEGGKQEDWELYTRDEVIEFKTAEDALDYAIKNIGHITIFDFRGKRRGFLFDARDIK